MLWGDIASARDFDRAGRVQFGPTHPAVAPVFDAVRQETRPDDVVAFFRARTMTLMTDRRSIQTTSLDRVRRRADWFAQRKGSSYSQPSPTAIEARAAGLIPVWEDRNWVLWRVVDAGRLTSGKRHRRLTEPSSDRHLIDARRTAARWSHRDRWSCRGGRC